MMCSLHNRNNLYSKIFIVNEAYHCVQTCDFLNAAFYNPKQQLLKLTQMDSTQSMHLIKKIFNILNCKLKILQTN